MTCHAKFDFNRLAIWSAIVLVLSFGVSSCRSRTDAATRGKELFETCVPCHQSDGSGNQSVGAPNIAGLQDWYIEEQLEDFRNGARGLHFNDIEGMRMRPMALSLLNSDDVKLVAHYVSTLPLVRHAPTINGDPKAGRAAFGTCRACHGPQGTGNPDVLVPRITGTDDWYLVTQLRKFRSGVRGANPNDIEGNVMRPIAQTLAGEDAIRNVVAYIGTLKAQP